MFVTDRAANDLAPVSKTGAITSSIGTMTRTAAASAPATAERVKEVPLDPYDRLTAREREILQMTAESQSSTEVGRRLFISPRTVEIHRQNAMRKLGLRNQGELIRYALKKGILLND